MAKKIISREKYRFKKGQTMHLDLIYEIQGLCGGDWWEPVPDLESGSVSGKTVEIKRDITIEIIER